MVGVLVLLVFHHLSIEKIVASSPQSRISSVDSHIIDAKLVVLVITMMILYTR